jgi:hypothetical protein
MAFNGSFSTSQKTDDWIWNTGGVKIHREKIKPVPEAFCFPQTTYAMACNRNQVPPVTSLQRTA